MCHALAVFSHDEATCKWCVRYARKAALLAEAGLDIDDPRERRAMLSYATNMTQTVRDNEVMIEHVRRLREGAL